MKCVLFLYFYTKLDDDDAVDGSKNENEEKKE
jgi:hypothetical protein